MKKLLVEKMDFDEKFFDEQFPYFIHQLQNAVQLMRLNWELYREKKEESYLKDTKAQIIYVEKLFAKITDSSLSISEEQMQKDFLCVELRCLLKKVFHEFCRRDNEHEFVLELSEQDLLIPMEVFYMQEALRILLENAVKYTPSGEKIILKLSESEEMIKICLKNTGIGIERSLQQKIFEPFQRGNNTNPGFGLGLNIAQKIIAFHKGTIEVESDERSVVSFLISLPKITK